MPKSYRRPTHFTHARWTAAEAATVLAEAAASGLSLAAFARCEGLAVRRLYRWRQELGAEREKRPTFIEVRPSPAGHVEIDLVSGRTLRVAETIAGDALARLVEVLERQTPC
jgi:transposase-like protein